MILDRIYSREKKTETLEECEMRSGEGLIAIKEITIIIWLLVMLVQVVYVSPAFGISLSIGTNDVSVSSSYSLDKSAALQGEAVISREGLYQVQNMAGSGDNILNQRISGKDYSISSTVESSGQIDHATSSAASSDCAILSQNVVGSGTIGAEVAGTVGERATNQVTYIENGDITSTQVASLDNMNTVTSSQNTGIKGEMVYIASNALSQENNMIVSGEGSAQDIIRANLASTVATDGYIQGNIASDECEYINNDILNEIASKEGSGRYDSFASISNQRSTDANKPSITSFNTMTINAMASATTTLPYIPPDNNAPNGKYAYLGDRWITATPQNPEIRFYLTAGDGPFQDEGLDRAAFKSSVSAAAKTWDQALPYTNLFYREGYIGDTTANHYIRNRINTIGWGDLTKKGAPTSAAALTTTWLKDIYGAQITYPIKGRIDEVDITFNSNTWFEWTTSGEANKIDVQTVALHELGHGVGLWHVTQDTTEIMKPAVGLGEVKHDLGTGDISGIQLLYPGRGDLNGDGKISLSETNAAISQWQSGKEPLAYPVYYINLWSRN